MTRRSIALVAALGGFILQGGSAVAAEEDFFLFRVCNQSKTEASVALSALYAPRSSDYVVAGWWTVPGHECRDIGKYPRGNFYFFAKARHGSTWWGQRDLELCVEYPGPFKRINLKNYKCAGNALKPFRHVVVERSVYEWTLSP